MCLQNQATSSAQRYFIVFIVIVIILIGCLWTINPKSNNSKRTGESSHAFDQTTNIISRSEQPDSRHADHLPSMSKFPISRIYDTLYQLERKPNDGNALVRDLAEKATEMPERRPEIKSTDKSEENVRIKSQHRYLIYLCDNRASCSGFADRQRAIVGLYLLSIATNRTFGVTMTSPTNITEFYVPNEVNWNIKMEDLAGKSTAYLEHTFQKKNCSLDNINSDYPEDVLFIRHIYDLTYTIGRQRHYRDNLPNWATGSIVLMFGHAWITLMTPTSALRHGVNSLLMDIAKGMKADARVIPVIQRTKSCRNACGEIINIALSKNQSSSISKCLVVLSNFTEVKGPSGIHFLSHTCPVTKAIKPAMLNSIQTATGYDYLELNLVCVHVRLGLNSSLKSEAVEYNRFEDVDKIWDHVRPYIHKGHHLYVASDSQQVRDQVKKVFGSRAHVSSEPIIHIAKLKRNQSGWQAMRTSLVEQLLLATSCKVLIYSDASGYSKRAAMVRHVLTRGRGGFETFSFSRGKVTKIDFDLRYHSRNLPSPVS